MPPRASSRWWVVAAMSAATIVLTIDLFGVNVALPTIARDLHLSNATLQWIPSIYFLMLAAPLVAAGTLGDVFGRRRVLLIGCLAVAAGSLYAALAPSGGQLLLARAISGIGAAFVTAVSLSIVSDAFPPERRGFAIGLWSGVGAVGAAIGPLVGGLVTETLGWRWLFAIDIPIALGAIVITLLVVTESRDPDARGVDVSGALLVTVGFGLVAFGLLEGPTDGWLDAEVVLALVAGTAALVAFVRVESRSSHPLVDVAWLGRAPALGTSLVALAGNAAFAAVMLYLTLYFQGVRGDGPIGTGLAFLAFTVPLGLASPAAGALSNRLPLRLTMSSGMLLLALGAGVLASLSATTSIGWVYVGLAVSAVGQAVVFNISNIAAVSSVPAARQGMAAGVISGIRQVGSLLGLAAAGVAFAAAGGAELAAGPSTGDPVAFIDGFRAALLVVAVGCFAGMVAAWWARTPEPTVVMEPASAPR